MNRERKDGGRTRTTTVSTRTRPNTSDEAAEAKRKLEALFSGNGNSGASSSANTNGRASISGAGPRRSPSGQVFASPRKSTGRQPSDYRLRLERLRMAREPEQIRAATDHFLEKHQLPDEVDILFKVLHHPSENVLRDAMGQLSSLLMQGRLNGTMLLADRLKELSARVQEEATHSYINGLRNQLEALKEDA